MSLKFARQFIILCLVLGLGRDLALFAQSPDAIEGFSHPYRTANVAAATSGIVDEWLVEEGQTVAFGQPLVRLDDRLHQKLLAIAKVASESRGEIETAEAELQLRQQRLKAIDTLARKNHATADELYRAQTDVKAAMARILTAQERQINHQLEYEKLLVEAEAYVVRAPFQGVITRYQKMKGEYVSPVQPEVCELVDLSAISARFLVPHYRLGDLNNGDTVQVHFTGTKIRRMGTVSLSPFPDAETGMKSVKVRIGNLDGSLRAGQPCTLLLAN